METVTQRLLLFVTYVAFSGATMLTVMSATSKTDTPIFIFGDSTADVGTNNHLPTCTAKANHRYHGIDFGYSKPTGRFSNGKNAADQIVYRYDFKLTSTVRLLGDHKLSPPPFLSLFTRKATFRRNLFRGANFASGGAGIFSETGFKRFVRFLNRPNWSMGSYILNKVICMVEQIQQFATVHSNVTELLGPPKAANDLLQNSVYIIIIGSNDLFEYTVSQFVKVGHSKEFIANLTEAYATHLANLYKLDARKFGIIGIPPIGCCPAARATNVSGGCYEVLNDNARSFYKTLQSLLSDFTLIYKGFKYSLGNSYAMTMNVIDNPRGNRFKEVRKGCCGNRAAECKIGAKLCSNRGDFLFWDMFHPTEKASELAAITLVYGEGPEYVTVEKL